METVDIAVSKLGPQAHGLVSNAGTMADVMQLRSEVEKYTDAIDLLFVNAGYGRFGGVEDVDEQHFDELFNMLVKGTFFYRSAGFTIDECRRGNRLKHLFCHTARHI